jgi:D-alanyl-D-alanine carboxypeptidase (penicillin-binding protein 5/6)
LANDSYTSLLVGDKDGRVYYSENIQEMHPLASVTKVMTLMVVYDSLRDGEISLNDRVKLSGDSRNVGGSMIWVAEGVKLTVEDLIKATAIYSANNAAYALAEYIGNGDVDKFVQIMNLKASELGLDDDLDFYTPMGLPPSMTGENMDVGTAFGIYRLSIEALKYPEYIKIASMEEDWIQGGTQHIINRNKLLSKENGIFGMKTGHHSEAGYNISVAAKRENITTITVVFGSPNEEVRDSYVRKYIDKFYDEFSIEKLIDKENFMVEVKVIGGERESIKAYPQEDFEAIISENSEVKIKKTYVESIEAPIENGEVLGNYQLILGNEIIKEGLLYTRESLPKDSFIRKIKRMF